jgi:diaminopimelate epimerase
MDTLRFAKIQGCGNSFVVVDAADVHAQLPIRMLCSRSFGLGADGVMVVGSPGDPIEVSMYNPDGSIMGMCGNGIRCVVRYLYERFPALTPHLTFTVHGRTIRCETVDRGTTVSVDMGAPSFEASTIPLARDLTWEKIPLEVAGTYVIAHAVSMGNPHAIIFVENDAELQSLDLEKIGPALEHHASFPDRANVSFAVVNSQSRCTVRVWERGAGATLACGTGACAVAVVGIRRGIFVSPVTVALPGGSL